MEPDDPNKPGSLEAGMGHFLAQEKVEELTPVQAAFLKLTWAVLVAVVVGLGFIVIVWRSELPPVPPITATPDQMEHYRTLTEIANDSLKTFIENVILLVLYPALTLFAGYTLGKNPSRRTDDVPTEALP